MIHKKISYGKQFINKKDISYVAKALSSELISQGSHIKKFESQLINILGCKNAISCNSGTSAIYLALQSINLNKDDTVIMPAINFIASYNLCKLLNAKIFLADVDPLTGQMTPDTFYQCIKLNKIKKIKAIVTMYLGGHPENIEKFYNIKKKFSCYLIEDACHALGSIYYFNKKLYNVGSASHSDLCTFSLHPLKTITTGEGGVVTTNNKYLARKIYLLRSHGIEKKKDYWKYNIKLSGFNFRLSDINAALGISQLKKIRKFVHRRNIIADFYYRSFKSLEKYINIPTYNRHNFSSWHLFLVHLDFDKIGSTKDKFIKFMIKNKIYVQFHYIPIFYFRDIYKKDKNYKKIFPGSVSYYKTAVSLPIYYNLSSNDQNYIVKIIKKFIYSLLK
jgi:dTDP-4-amino-4,6-dideoxygalactose transaminase